MIWDLVGRAKGMLAGGGYCANLIVRMSSPKGRLYRRYPFMYLISV